MAARIAGAGEVARAGARLGRPSSRPALSAVSSLAAAGTPSESRSVAEVITAPCAGAITAFTNGLGRVEIVAVHADIDLAALDALDGEPVDEGGIGARCAGRAAWRARLRASARSGWRASAPRPRCAPRWPDVELVGLALELGAQRLRAAGAPARASARAASASRSAASIRPGLSGRHVAFQAEALVLARRARAHLLAHQGQELLGRAQHRAVGQPRLPVGRGQGGG